MLLPDFKSFLLLLLFWLSVSWFPLLLELVIQGEVCGGVWVCVCGVCRMGVDGGVDIMHIFLLANTYISIYKIGHEPPTNPWLPS